MRLKLFFADAVAASLFTAAFALPARAADHTPAPRTFEDEKLATDLRILELLNDAEAVFESGLGEFRGGRPETGRAHLQEAFSLLASTLEEDALPTELKSDFLAMVEKIRAWEGDEPLAETPSELDVPASELKAVPASKLPSVKNGGGHKIAIDPENELTKRFIALYTGKRRDEVSEALARSGRYRGMMISALKKAGLPEELFYLVMAESEYKQKALSRSGAGGLWQFMPFTGRSYGLEVSYWIDERYDPEKATQAAISYLSDLYDWFGDWHLALAAYNRGENGIGRDLKFSRSADFAALSARKALPRETHNYVPKFMACVLIGEHPERYGIKPVYEKPAEFDSAPLERDLALDVAAKCAGTSEEGIRALNPQLRAWCTPKNRKGFVLKIPKGTKSEFESCLAATENWNPGPTLVRYTVRGGDFLGKIARRYRTSVKSIMRSNNITNPRRIRPGMILKIQPGKSSERKK